MISNDKSLETGSCFNVVTRNSQPNQSAAKRSLIVIFAQKTIIVVTIATAIRVIVVLSSIFIFREPPSATGFTTFISIAKMTGFRHEKGNFRFFLKLKLMFG